MNRKLKAKRVMVISTHIASNIYGDINYSY
jgi:hypothetical protein